MFCSASPSHLLSMSAGETTEKGGVDFAGGGLGQHGLAGAGRAVQQHAAAGVNAEFGGQFGVLKGINHFQADVFFHIVQPGNIVEPDGRAFP